MHDIIPNDTEASQAVPIVDVTVNAGFTIRAVMPDTPGSWWVAAEDTGRGVWVTWLCAAGTGDFAGTLGFAWGNYFGSPDPGLNRLRALADLAVRAGTMPGLAHRIADEILQWHPPAYGDLTSDAREDRRMARRLRQGAGR